MNKAIEYNLKILGFLWAIVLLVLIGLFGSIKQAESKIDYAQQELSKIIIGGNAIQDSGFEEAQDEILAKLDSVYMKLESISKFTRNNNFRIQLIENRRDDLDERLSRYMVQMYKKH